MPLSEYDTHASLLADVIDRLGDVLSVLMAQGGGKPGQITPAPRPVTGVERARKRMADEKHDALVAEVNAAMQRWDAAHPG